MAIRQVASKEYIIKVKGADQVKFQDGAIVAAKDDDVSLGTSTVEFKDGFFDGTVTTDALVVDGASTLTGGATVGAGGTLKLDVGTLAALGADNTDAAAIAKQVTYVTASDGTVGVILPAGTIGEFYIVHNTVAAQNLKVYPPASGSINGGTATTGNILVAGEETGVFIKVAANTWHGGVLVDF